MGNSFQDRKLPAYLERRNFARRTVIESRLVSVELGDSARGVLIDVGEGGVAVQPFVPLPVGAESDVLFETPNGARVKAHGMVAWVGQNGRTGIRFTDVEPEGLVEIRRWTDEDEEEPEGRGSRLALPALEQTQRGDTEAQRKRRAEPASLDQVMEQACALTGADGAAVAWRDADEVRCAAAVGNAPDVGTTVAPDKGLAGECLRTGQPLVCCNARADRRIDREAALALNMGSCAMAPIVENGTAVGLIAVFSTHVDTFDEDHLATLVEIAAKLPKKLTVTPQP